MESTVQLTQRQSSTDDYAFPNEAIPAIVLSLASRAGFRFNGDAPWDIKVNDSRLYRRILMEGSLGFGEAFMDGWWECERLDQFFHRFLAADADHNVNRWRPLHHFGELCRHALFNLQSRRRAFLVGEHHYDIGNDVFESMLDSSMSYSCGYWKDAATLEEAQRNKLDLICRKLDLQQGESLLDIGCGWGGLAHYAASHYGVKVLGITVSREQRKLALERCAGLPVEIELRDYRDVSGQFDKIVSVGMFEHVGPKNYKRYFGVVQRLLADQGLFLLHTIGSYQTTRKLDPWTNKYVFPNGRIPSAVEISNAVENQFLIEDWENFGSDYDRTLMAWWRNFEHGWPKLEAKYGKRFHRMWTYYLMSCAGYFRARQGQLWQLVLSKRIRSGGYRSVR